MKQDRNDRTALKQLGIGFSGEFTGRVSAVGRTFKKQGILYTVICLTQVHEVNSKETVCHVWFDILYSDLETFNLNKGDKIPCFLKVLPTALTLPVNSPLNPIPNCFNADLSFLSRFIFNHPFFCFLDILYARYIKG